VLPALKEGGILIYSTCSYSEEEDEAIADWLVEGFKVEGLRLKFEWGIVETQSEKHKAYGYRFYPDKVKGEGFFIAAFRKKGEGSGEWQVGKKRNKLEKLSAKEVEVVNTFLKTVDDFFFIRQNEEVIAIPKCFEEDLTAVQKALYIKKAGVRLGSIIRGELIPDHELALSTIISPNCNSIEVDEATALQYLRKQDIILDTSLKGWALIKYQQLLLGWVKVLPNRINNYYPKEWRILNK
jgi:NOL1/NOP2/fmu family ribosome biogenesis protein